MRVRGVLALLTGLVLCAGVTSCTGQDEPTAPTVTKTVKPPKPVQLTFGVWGGTEEQTAYQRVVNAYNAVTGESNVTLAPFGTESDLVSAVEGGDVPDVFLVSRDDLPYLRENKITQPLSNLLDERAVDFGDSYTRDALEAFSVDRDLQCMPYDQSPDVVYYNKRWVDFDKMAAQGLPVPTFDEDPRKAPRWSLEMFQAAAGFATRPRRNIRGLYVDPSLRGLAPFIYSGGGMIYNDEDDPTSLSFSDGASRDALSATLPLLRDARLTLTADQLAKATPLQYFERGKLAMMVGTRSLVPELRGTEGLDFDVMPMPVIDDDATVGDITGICLSATAASTTEAADFLVHAISDDSVRQVVQAGYMSPANQIVALSDSFLEIGQVPLHSSAFVAGVRAMKIAPLLPDVQALLDAVGPDVRSLVTDPDPFETSDIDEITARIDEESRAVLDPDYTPSPEPSPGDEPSPDS